MRLTAPLALLLVASSCASPALRMETKGPEPERPARAVVLALNATGRTSRDVREASREAAMAAPSRLDPSDEIGILAFDEDARWLLPLRRVEGSTPALESALSLLEAGGGTRFLPVLDAAKEALRGTRAGRKHVILVAAGRSGEIEDIRNTAATLAREGVTVSTIGLGKGFDPHSLGVLAEAGGGRMDYTYEVWRLREIVLAEVERWARGDVDRSVWLPDPR